MGVIIVVGVLLVAGFVILIYNGLARLRLLADNAWADIDVQLKRRHDLVPALVASVTGHAGYERQTLEAVVEARTRATHATTPGASGPAEGALAVQIRQIFALAEAYPDLRATESFLALQRNLTEIEDQVQNTRRYYNAVVRDLNTRLAQFPANLIAGLLGFRPRAFFQIEGDDERSAPVISLPEAR
jgi:LemA protein